jgi:hypothetical protein
MKLLRPLIAFATRPSVSLVVGAILVVTSLVELGETAYTFAEGAQAEHGTLLYGLLVALKSLGEADEGMKRLGEATSPER